jgi:hypothetical protein
VGLRLGIAFALISLMGCSGCGSGGAEDRRAFSSADSWYAPPSDLAGFRPLEKERFAPVIADLQGEAQAALADGPAMRVSAEQATRLVGRPLPPDGECVLLRAVVLFEGTGAFDVGTRGSAMHVHHRCLGRRPAPMGRKALVAVLSAVPDSVFVSCSMIE